MNETHLSGFRINYNFNTQQQREVEIIFVSDQRRFNQLQKGDILLQINGINVDILTEKELNKFVLNSSNPNAAPDYEIRWLTIYRPFVEDQIEISQGADDDEISMIQDTTALVSQEPDLSEESRDPLEPQEAVKVAQQEPAKITENKLNGPINSSTPMRKNTTIEEAQVNLDNFEYPIEEIRIIKVNGAMGLSIVGGGNVACHPFGIDRPGIFISKIVPDGAASRTNLRVGDRILKVNGVDVTNMSHDETVEELKRNSLQVVLLVSHDPQPSGMQEIVLHRSFPEETLGIRINGGIENKSANIYDPTDEGIFVLNIINGTLAHRDSRLQVGTRIMEVSHFFRLFI